MKNSDHKKRKKMFKHLLLVSSFIFCADAMELHELHMIRPHNKSDEVSISNAGTELTRSYEAHELGWVPAMYDASGLQDCMSKECFMVNALREIKERMTPANCSPRLQDSAEDIKELPACDGEHLFMGANLIGSFAALTTTLVMATSVKMPLPFPERLVSGSCVWVKLILNYTTGMEWADSCIVRSMKYDTPCNVTAAREAFNKNGGGQPQPSFCCYDIADKKCYEVGVDYNKNIYPAVHNQALWDAWKPFMIACPAILAVQLGYIGSIHLRRYLRHKEALIDVQAEPLLMQVSEFAQEEV